MNRLHINHIKSDAVLRTMRFCSSFSKHQITSILLKALGYKNLGHLKKAYIIDDRGYIFSGDDLSNRGDYRPYNIAYRGLIFNENELEVKLRISYEKVMRLKNYIDNPFKFGDRYDGNIVHSDLGLVEYGLKQIQLGNVVRIMADYPFRFYTRRNKDFCIEYKNQKYLVSFFYFDSFYISDKNYFKGKKRLNRYTEALLGQFLEYDNVMFNSGLISDLDECELKYLDFLKSKFDCYPVHFPFNSLGFKKEGVFFPRLKENFKLSKETLLFCNHS